MTEINSPRITKRINDFIAQGCGSSVSPTHQNRPPKANAGKNLVITLPTNVVTLQGTGSDPDNDPLTYRWTKVSPSDNEIISSPNAQTTRVVNLREGVHRYMLTVTDSHGAWDTSVVTISVTSNYDDVSLNRPPKANAGNNQVITLPTNVVTLQGSGSDPDKDPLTYRWSKVTQGDKEIIRSPNTRITAVENLHEGVHRYMLTVTDSRKAFDTSVVTITVNPQRLPPTANAGEPIVIALPTHTVTLNGSGTDPNGSTLIFQWTKISGNGGNIISETNPKTSVEDLQEGTYQFRLTVTNNYKLSGSDDVQVTVNAQPNQPPQAEAGPNITIRLPINRVELRGQGTDPDNDTLTYHWRYGSGPHTFNINSPQGQNTVVTNLVEGEYYFVLEVSDNHHTPAVARVRVKVNPPAHVNRPPVVSAGPDRQLDLSKDSQIILLGTASDSDGRITSYKWEKISGPESFSLTNQDQSEGRIENPVVGNYTFRLTVTDNDGAIASDIVLLQVSSSPGKSWIWALIGIAAGLGAATWITRRFLWFSAKQKVVAYYLDQREESLVHSYMPYSDTTEGYSVGHLSRRKIRLLKKKGVAFKILDTTRLVVSTPGVERVYKFRRRRGAYTWKRESTELREGNFENIIPISASTREGELPAFYIITLDAPLLPQFQNELDEAGITVLQRIPYDSYIVFISDSEMFTKLHELQSSRFRFIRVIRPYLPEDTGFLILKDHLSSNPDGSEWIIDLVLHREQDGTIVRDFLETNRIEWIDSYRNVIRARLRRDFNLAVHVASNKYIQAIFEHIPPILHIDFARRLIGLDGAEKSVSSRYLNETGEGELIAVADTGIDSQHPDLVGRIKKAVAWGRKQLNDSSDPHGHGTHVTSSIVGTGQKSAGQLSGVAPRAEIFFQSLLDDNNQLVDLQLNLPPLLEEAFKGGAKIMNLSWGSPTESYYTFDSVAIDQFVFDNPEMLVVVSAGNATQIIKDNNGKEIALFGSVGSLATTKNGITVGASTSNRNNEDGESIATFSSRGPCKPDRRVKPDIVAPGTSILSARSSRAPKGNFDRLDTNNFYAYLHGSSMAAPIVAGAAALVRQYYKSIKNFANPSAALIKATLLNGTRMLKSESAMQDSGIIPNNSQGFGLLDLLMTVPNQHTNFSLQFRDAIRDPELMLSQAGKRRIFKLEIRERTWLRVCLVFVDSPKIGAQNDLNLIVGLEGSPAKWTGNEGINAKEQYLSSVNEDFTNNVEVVRISEAQPGVYTIAIEATIAPLKYDVGFALVVSTGDLSARLSN